MNTHTSQKIMCKISSPYVLLYCFPFPTNNTVWVYSISKYDFSNCRLQEQKKSYISFQTFSFFFPLWDDLEHDISWTLHKYWLADQPQFMPRIFTGEIVFFLVLDNIHSISVQSVSWKLDKNCLSLSATIQGTFIQKTLISAGFVPLWTEY